MQECENTPAHSVALIQTRINLTRTKLGLKREKKITGTRKRSWPVVIR